MRNYEEMTVSEAVKFVISPCLITFALMRMTAPKVMIFYDPLVVVVGLGCVALLGYLAYFYEVDRTNRRYEMKVKAEAALKALQVQHQLEEGALWWSEHAAEVDAWRDQITGCGSPKGVSS